DGSSSDAKHTSSSDGSLASELGVDFLLSCNAPCADGTCRGCVEYYCTGCTEDDKDLCRTFSDTDGTVKPHIQGDTPCSDKATSGGGCAIQTESKSGAALYIVNYNWTANGVDRAANEKQCTGLINGDYYP